MTRTAPWIFLVSALPVLVEHAFAQVPSEKITIGTPSDGATITIGGSGPAIERSFSSSPDGVKFEGLLVRSDGQTLSIELPDERVIRFQLNDRTIYSPEGGSDRLGAFRVADFVSVEAEPAERGYFGARRVAFVRKPSQAEQAELLECPELNYRWEENVLEGATVDPANDSRKLSLVTKPAPIAISESVHDNSAHNGTGDDLIQAAREEVDEAYGRLPNFLARQVTSMFHSTTKKVKWVPNGVIAAEIAYDGKHESYSGILLDGKQPANAPSVADASYMRSFNNAWSTGDFETIAHCVFDGLEDSDFHKAAAQRRDATNSVVYEFSGSRASTCVAVLSQSQVAYSQFRGSLTVNPQTKQVLHVELEAVDLPKGFPLDRAERSVDFAVVEIGSEQFVMPITAYWFGCYRNSYSCFLNRVDFSNYRRFGADSVVRFVGKN